MEMTADIYGGIIIKASHLYMPSCAKNMLWWDGNFHMRRPLPRPGVLHIIMKGSYVLGISYVTLLVCFLKC